MKSRTYKIVVKTYHGNTHWYAVLDTEALNKLCAAGDKISDEYQKRIKELKIGTQKQTS